MKALTVSIIITTLVALNGCAAFSKVQDVANTVVKDYCKTNLQDRAILRMQVDNAVQPNSVQINCASDNTISPAQLKAIQEHQAQPVPPAQ